jgi:hypothetical protein
MTGVLYLILGLTRSVSRRYRVVKKTNTYLWILRALSRGNEDGIPVALFIPKKRLILCSYKKPYT